MGSVTKLSTTRAPRSELVEVLRLINVGRKALRMPPLKEIPKGVIDHPYESPLPRAFERAVYPEGGFVETLSARSSKEARVLLMAFNTAAEEDHPQNVLLPFPLARFSRRFDKGGYPALVDDDTMSLEEATERLGLDVSLGTLEELVIADLLPVIAYDGEGVKDCLIRWSTLKAAFTIQKSSEKSSNKRRAA